MTIHDSYGLNGKVAVVTGASSGIGQRIAVEFASAGATVYSVARRLDRLESLAEAHERVVAYQADLGDEGECEGVIPKILDRAGRIDILVNNAGTSNVARAESETTLDFHRVVNLNLTAAFILCRDAGRVMIAQGGGVITNVASTLGLVASSTFPQAAYAASKAGCINLTRELAVQWARHNIRVNAVAPGWVATEMTGEWLLTQRGQDEVARTTPIGRAAKPSEIAAAVLFLSSAVSSYVTGAIIPVDGGMTAI